jgi:hypothetical protein
VWAQVESTRPDQTHSAMIASIMSVLGLPTIVGFFFEAKTSGADMAPEPGKRVPSVGNVASWLVRMKWHPSLSRR